MFEKIFVEKELLHSPQTQQVLKRFKKEPIILNRYTEVWGKVKKPYLQKRESLNLFIAKKRGDLIKEAPPAYGLSGEPHYYFINAYNCIYECEYCYLQGYFHTPDLVMFLNHQEMIMAMKKTLEDHEGKVWFHAGEFSDSLALSHITGELEHYFNFFADHPRAFLELRTKSANIRELLSHSPLENIITSFSLSPKDQIKNIDHKTPSLEHRLKAISQLADKGFPIGIHFDPIIFNNNFENEYGDLINDLLSRFKNTNQLQYFSLGVVRFTEDVYHQMKKNYPTSVIHKEEFIKSFDNKVRYPKPIRLNIMEKIKSLLLKAGISESKIYLCME